MTISRWLISAALVGVVGAGLACTQNAADQTTNTAGAALDKTKQGTETALDATRKGADKALDATREGAAAVMDEAEEVGEETVDVTKNVAQKAGEKTKEIVSTTGEVITDVWVTTKVSARFVDETLLKGSNINVDTNNRVVTLKGTVGSDAAKARAAAIARGTEGVTRVVNQLVVSVK
jgi:osmotically-inducible protein OsmY